MLVDVLVHPGKTALFVLAAISLIPLAWLIGEATEHAGEHTGPRIGGLLNASFGNAPEVIIALIAVADNLPNVVRGSLTLLSIGPAIALLVLYLVVTTVGVRRRAAHDASGATGWGLPLSLAALGAATAATAVTSEILVHSLQA